MTKQRHNIVNLLGALAWVQPNPTWQNMVVGGRMLIQTYTLINVSQQKITIKALGFAPGGDARLSITGGTCKKGLVLAPKTTCTIQVAMDPRTIGQAEQRLIVQHKELGGVLESRIHFSVLASIAKPDASRQSYLVDETPGMDRARRLAEQDGHRRLAKVHAREHADLSAQQPAPEGELQNNILQNPWLDSQRFDGVDNNLNPTPPLNTEARREFDNERQQQEMEKQLRLGNMPTISTAPRPEGPR